jgi:hypothetical protein
MLRALVLSTVLAGTAWAAPPCTPTGNAKIELPDEVELRGLIDWASVALCKTIVATPNRLYRRVATANRPQGAVGAAEREKFFRQALGAAGFEVRGDPVWTVGEAKVPVKSGVRPSCRAPAPTEKLPRVPLGMVDLNELAEWYEVTFCKPLALPAHSGNRQVAIFAPPGTITAKEADEAVRKALAAGGFTVEEAPALVIGATGEALPVRPEAKPIDFGNRLRCDGNRCTIARSLYNEILVDSSRMATEARIVPALKEGVVQGIKLFAIRPNSVLARLGLQNGDLVRSVNGISLATPDQALAAYARLREASHFTIELERRGAPLTIDVRIE